jgi:hypothetical protein
VYAQPSGPGLSFGALKIGTAAAVIWELGDVWQYHGPVPDIVAANAVRAVDAPDWEIIPDYLIVALARLATDYGGTEKEIGGRGRHVC